MVGVIAMLSHTTDHVSSLCGTFIFFLTPQRGYLEIFKSVTNTLSQWHTDGLFPEDFLVQITVSIRESAGNRWHSQIRIIWQNFIYKVTNYEGVSEELEEPPEIEKIPGVSNHSWVATIIFKNEGRGVSPRHRLHQLERTRRTNPFSPVSSSSVSFLQAQSLRTSAHPSSPQTSLGSVCLRIHCLPLLSDCVLIS